MRAIFVILLVTSLTISELEAQCNSMGLFCKNCTDLYLCSPNGHGFIETWIETCSDGFTCLERECTNVPNPDCDQTEDYLDFVCRTPGTYPDPFDCRKFHYCVPEERGSKTLRKLSDSCTSTYAYNTTSNACDVDLTVRPDYCVETLVPKCKSFGFNGVLEGKESLYYICLRHPNDERKLYPFLYSCENNKVYSPEEYVCK